MEGVRALDSNKAMLLLDTGTTSRRSPVAVLHRGYIGMGTPGLTFTWPQRGVAVIGLNGVPYGSV